MTHSEVLLQRYKLSLPYLSSLITPESINRNSKLTDILINEACANSQLSPLFTDEWTGTRVWDAALILTNYILSNFYQLLHFIQLEADIENEVAENKDGDLKTRNTSKIRIIELGSGTGVVGIVLAKLLTIIKAYENQFTGNDDHINLIKAFAACTFEVVLTDQMQVLPTLINNVKLNFENENDSKVANDISQSFVIEANDVLEVALSIQERDAIKIKAQELLWGSDNISNKNKELLQQSKLELGCPEGNTGIHSDRINSDGGFNIVFIADCINPLYGETAWYDLYVSLVNETKCGALIYFTQERRGDNYDVNLFLEVMALKQNEVLLKHFKSLAEFEVVYRTELSLHESKSCNSSFGDIHEIINNVSNCDDQKLSPDNVVDLFVFRRNYIK